MPKSDRFPRLPIICMVTDRAAGGERDLLALIAAAARAGVDLIQIRDHDLDAGALAGLTRHAIDAVSGSGARIMVNDRVDVALAAGAAGAHLRGDGLPAARVRAITPTGFLIGRSVHSDGEAAEIEAAGGYDYLMFGTVFPSKSKPADHRPAGLDALARVCARARIPVIAIGGITVSVAADVRRAGAAGVAAIGAFKPGSDPVEFVRAVRSSFDT
jgi:thiamine-phosphate pyrophosphorylase